MEIILKAVCKLNYYGEGFDNEVGIVSELEIYLRELNIPICYQKMKYNYFIKSYDNYPDSYNIIIPKEVVIKTPVLQDEYTDLHTENGEMHIHLSIILFNKYFIDLSKLREQQINEIFDDGEK